MSESSKQQHCTRCLEDSCRTISYATHVKRVATIMMHSWTSHWTLTLQTRWRNAYRKPFDNTMWKGINVQGKIQDQRDEKQWILIAYSSCEKECSGKRTKTIYRAPPVLAIHLDRFGKNGKNEKMVKFPETLDIKRYVTTTEQEALDQSQYHLYGVITHRGASQQGGQYAAFAKSSNGLWHCFDNELVRNVLIDEAIWYLTFVYRCNK